MKANELRIGNYVNDIDKDLLIVTEIEKEGIYDNDRLFSTFDDIFPIQLTEEWLVKLGFINLRHKGNHIFELLHNDTIGYRFSVEGQYGYPEIKYVHQLQNLYFALTEEELTNI